MITIPSSSTDTETRIKASALSSERAQSMSKLSRDLHFPFIFASRRVQIEGFISRLLLEKSGDKILALSLSLCPLWRENLAILRQASSSSPQFLAAHNESKSQESIVSTTWQNVLPVLLSALLQRKDVNSETKWGVYVHCCLLSGIYWEYPPKGGWERVKLD